MNEVRALEAKDEAIVAHHVAEFARFCAMPGADTTVLAKHAEEGAARLRRNLESGNG